MKESEAEIKPKRLRQAQNLIMLSFVAGLIVVLVQWICLLAVLEPLTWMPLANRARWIWTASYFFPLTGILLKRKPDPDTLLISVRNANFFKIVDAIYHTVMVLALLNGHLKFALTLGFGGSAFYAIQRSILPRQKVEKEVEEKEFNGYYRVNAIFHSLFFATLLITLELHSVALSISLFVAMMVYKAVSLLWMMRRFIRSTMEKS